MNLLVTSYFAEKRRRALVGGNAGWDQQTDHSSGLDQRMATFDEQRIEIGIAARQQRIMSRLAGHSGRVDRALLGMAEIIPKRIAIGLELRDQPSPIRRALR